MTISLRKPRVALAILVLILVGGAAMIPLISGSCRTRPRSPGTGEAQAIATMRAMTRGGVFPAEVAVARLVSEYPDTAVAGLGLMLQARIRMHAGDPNGAAALLDSKVIRDRTAIADYALLLRATALESAGRRAEARAAYEQIDRTFPESLRARAASLRVADMLSGEGQASAVPVILKALASKDDSSALLMTARAYEQSGDTTRALESYRRLYFFAPASSESAEAADALRRLNSTTAPATAEEALARADRLYEAKRYLDAANSYLDAFGRFPQTATSNAQLRRGIALESVNRAVEAIGALNSIGSGEGELRAEALYYVVKAYAASHQWEMVRSRLDEMMRVFPNSVWTPGAIVRAGQMAKDAHDPADALNFFRMAVNRYPGSGEVAAAQFEIAWAAHMAKNYAQSSGLLTEHLASYAAKNNDRRGQAGYWAARDSERAGKLAEARALYDAMQNRYSATWYGYLAKRRLDAMDRNGFRPAAQFPPDSPVGRAVHNLQVVNAAEELAGPAENQRVQKADQLAAIGADDWALEELDVASRAIPDSPRINLAIARLLRDREDNVGALKTLMRSYPDYSQMKPEELTREEWDVFYPLAYWDIIAEQARARGLEPAEVAGLIRQETVFNPRAVSPARAYGLMQLLVDTASHTARKYGIDAAITPETLFEPRLNIEIGTAYLRDQIDKYGRIEYVAAAYNAGPGRVAQWRASLPLEIDEWAEAIPFKETRGYVQGVVRNKLQYERLYDQNGQFRAEVGTRAARETEQAATQTAAPAAPPAASPSNTATRPRRVEQNDQDEDR